MKESTLAAVATHVTSYRSCWQLADVMPYIACTTYTHMMLVHLYTMYFSYPNLAVGSLDALDLPCAYSVHTCSSALKELTSWL